MIGGAKAWVVKLLSSVILIGSIGLGIFVIAGGVSQPIHHHEDVSASDTLRHFLAGDTLPPPTEMDASGCRTVIPAPSRAEIDENLRKAIESRNFVRYDELGSE